MKTAFVDPARGGRNLDARTAFFYQATGNTPKMVLKIPGVGWQHTCAVRDKSGYYLDGSKNYKMNIPADVPAKDFWSVVLFDPQTRSELQTRQEFPGENNKRDKLIENGEGSVLFDLGTPVPKSSIPALPSVNHLRQHCARQHRRSIRWRSPHAYRKRARRHCTETGSFD